jgi:hypothetical protein
LSRSRFVVRRSELRKVTCNLVFYPSPIDYSDSQCPRFHECRIEGKVGLRKTRRRFREAANLPILRTHHAPIRDLLFGVRKSIKVRLAVACGYSCAAAGLIRFSLGVLKPPRTGCLLGLSGARRFQHLKRAELFSGEAVSTGTASPTCNLR